MKKIYMDRKVRYLLNSILALMLFLGSGTPLFAQKAPNNGGSPVINAGNDATICENQALSITDASASNYISITWSTDGDGTWNPSPPTTINPIYYPGTNDKANAGFITLMLTANPGNPTSETTDPKKLTIQNLPEANAGIDATICETETYTLSDATASNYYSITWTTSGNGTFSSISALNPIYTPGTTDKTNGTVTLTITTTPISPCSIDAKGPVATHTDFMVLNVQASPTAGAGTDATICDTETYTLSDATAGNYLAITWTTGGDGSFSSTSALNPTYTPGTSDKSTGSFTLTITAVAEDPCTGFVDDDILITIQASPTADAGDDDTICDTETYTLSDATASNYSAITWTTGGDGSFSSTSALNPTYTPSTSDKSTGSFTLTITAVAEDPCTGSVDNDILITIQASPTADAGDDDTICDTETSYALVNATADDYESILWATLGNGTFDDDTELNPVYYPSANDISAGSVKIYLDAFAIAPCDLTKSVIVSAADTLILNFQASPTAAAGENDTICDTQFYTLSDATAENYSSITWTTSGDGSFTSISALNPTYSPGITDKSAGSVTLTITAVAEDPCIGFVDDDILLTIQASPTADTGGDDTICDTDTYTLSDATASDYDAIEWTTSGNGTFDDDASLNPVYTPGSTDKSSGEVTLTITAAPISPCGLNKEINVSNTDDIVLTIQASPIAYAGIDATICEDGEYEFDDADLDYEDDYLWETDGDGTLVPPGEGFRYTYIPGPADIIAGTVEICLTAIATSPCLVDSTDCMTLTITVNPTANAGIDATICEDDTYSLSDASADNYATLTWTTSGDGTFDDDSIENPTYTPGSGDASSGSVTLTITAAPNDPCTTSADDDMILSIGTLAVINAGPDANICTSGYKLKDATADDFMSTIWVTFGDGTFSDGTAINPYYYPGTNDLAIGHVKLSLVASPENNPPCVSLVYDDIELTITQDPPTVFAGADATTCEDVTYTFSDANAADYDAIVWHTYGDGTFADETVQNSTYTAGAGDILNGSVKIKLVASPIHPCLFLVEDQMILTFQNNPTIQFPGENVICEDATFTFTSTAFSKGSNNVNVSNFSSLSWTGGDGTFVFPDTYCKPTAGSLFGGVGIKQFNLGSINNSTGQSSGGYGKYLNLSTAITPGVSNSVYWTTGYATGNASLWIDFNMDGTFQTSERLINGHLFASSGNNASFTVPLGTAPGEKRLRIRVRSVSGSNDPCVNFTYGETEDYTVIITGTDGTIVPPTYTPGPNDISNETVQLCLTAQPINPCVNSVTECMTLDIQLLPVANAGGDDTVCEDSPYTISGASATDQSSVLWTTDGTGSFDVNSEINTTYNPSAGDITDGSIELCMTAEPISPCATSDDDCMTLTIQLLPVAAAGGDDTVCEDASYTLSDATAENYSSVTWTTNGDGSFDDPNVIIATYTPGASDISTGSVTLTLTAEPMNPCTTNDSDDIFLNIQLLPTAEAGTNATICEDDTHTVTGASAANYSAFVWSGGDGTFDDDDILTPTYTTGATDNSTGSVYLLLTAQPISPCTTAALDSLLLTIQKNPTVDIAADSASICYEESYTFSGVTYTDKSSVQWYTVMGGGFFDNDILENPTYNPSPTLDYIQGCIMLYVLASPINPCTITVTDSLKLCFQAPPTANAGTDATICEDGSHTLSGASASNYSALSWTGGDGSFDDNTALQPNYTPGSTDITDGTVELCLTAAPIDPCTVDSDDCMTLTIQLLPVADAGEDATICEGDTYTLSDATAENYTTVSWTTDGDGTFTDCKCKSAVVVNPTYVPGANDIIDGSIELCLIAEPLSPCTLSDEECMTLTIQLQPVSDAGDDGTVCEDGTYTLSDATAENYSTVTWTSSGTGSFDDPTLVIATYDPSAADVLLGSVTLTLTAEPTSPCTVEDTDEMILTIQLLPIADAGDDTTICEDATYTLSGATAENEDAVEWTSTGTGSFDDATLLSATYDPSDADILLGSVTLTLTAEAITPCSMEDTDDMVLNFQLLPIADAGDDDTVCEDGTYTLSDATAENYSSVTWTTNGTGTFTDPTIIIATYNPSADDIAAGSVELCMTAEPETPCTTSDEDCMTLTIQLLPIADAGADFTICEDGTYTLSGATAENESSVSWATDGTGSFDDNTLLGATYSPSADDIAAGSVELCLTTLATGPCTASDEDCMTLTINYLPLVDIGYDGSLCVSDALVLSDATAVGYSSLLWTSDGDGTFTDETVLNATYTPGSGDIAAGTFELCLTAQPIAPCTGTDQDCVTVTFFPLPTADAGGDATVCENKKYKLSGDASITIATEWVTSGDGTFNDVQLTDATYTPGANDIINGSVELCFRAYPIAPCTEYVEDCMILTIQGLPVADAGDNATICEDGEYLLSGSSTNGCGYVWSTAGDGSFDDITLAEATYTPGSDDILAGSVVLTLTASQCSPCLAYTDDDQMTLTINKFPTIVANDDSVCETGSITLSDLTAENYSSVLWTTDGDGDFDDATKLNAVYTPGSDDISNLSVILTITVEPIDPCVGNASDDMTLSIIWTPAAYAGDDVSILYDEPYTLENADAADYGSLLWTTGGDGTFSDNTELNPVYTPGTADIDNGSVILTLTANGAAPCTETSVDEIMLSIFHAPEVVITSPLHGDILYFNPVLITGTASDLDNDLAYVEIRINGGSWLLAEGLETWQLEVELQPCDNLIEARATDVEFFESDIDQINVTMNIQIIPVITGWQYISTFLTPLNTDLNVMNQDNDPSNNLYIMVDASGKIYSPPLNTNTIGNWNPYKGYKVKMNTAGTWTIHGNPVETGSVALPSGFSIFPVLTNYEVPITSVLTSPLTDVLIIFEIQTNNIYWPGGDLFTLTTLKPGYGYLGNFKNPVTVTYPEVICGQLDSKTTYETVANDGPWPITRTANVHLVSITNAAVSELNNADYIGAFDADGNCIGYASIDRNDGNYLLTIYGDDQMTPEKDGASENEIITFAAYDNFGRTQVVLHATFDNLMPQNNGLFTSNGLSKILSFKESATGIIGEENIAEMVSIYPNPARDEITISYPLNGTNSTVNAVFTNTAGKQVMTKKLYSSKSKVDVSNLASGIYMVTLQNNDNVVVKRLVIN